MPCHVAILKEPYLRLILSGEKTIESRLMKTRQPPMGTVASGERIFFKVSAGPFLATAIVREAEEHHDLTPARVEAVRQRLNDRICGPADYWDAKRDARFASFLHLQQVEPFDLGPDYGRANMRAWFTLPDAASPLLEIRLSDGAIRNGWVYVPRGCDFFGDGPAQLMMPDGQALASSVNDRRHVGGRGWRRYHRLFGNQPGDAVRFVRTGPGRFRVSFVKCRHAEPD